MLMIQLSKSDPREPCWVDAYSIEAIEQRRGSGRDAVVGSVVRMKSGARFTVLELPETVLGMIPALPALTRA